MWVKYQLYDNHISGLMISMLPSSAIYRDLMISMLPSSAIDCGIINKTKVPLPLALVTLTDFGCPI
jgi:hypothetical protein